MIELDEVFAYDTYRIVRIKDYRLGLPYYFLVVCVFCYIVIGQLIVNSQHLQLETAIGGSVRLQLRAPAAHSLIWAKSVKELSYCQNECKGDCSGNINQKKLNCPSMYANAEHSVFPAQETQGIFITTRVDEEEQTLPSSCADIDVASDSLRAGCRDWTVTKNHSYYIPQVEDYMIKIDHSMLAPELMLTRCGYDMADGCLLPTTADGHAAGKGSDFCQDNAVDPCQEYTRRGWPCPSSGQPDGWDVAIGANKRDDVMMLRTLLRSAGIMDLDTVDSTTTHYAKDWSYRRGGMVLLLQIHYDNTWASTHVVGTDTNKYRYEYSMLKVANQGYEVTQTLMEANRSMAAKRTVLRRHGIRIIVKQTGRIGQFSFQQMLLTLTASLGLMAAATAIVEVLLRFVLPEKKIYNQAKFEETQSFTNKTLTKNSLKVSLTRRIGSKSSGQRSPSSIFDDDGSEAEARSGSGSDENETTRSISLAEVTDDRRT